MHQKEYPQIQTLRTVVNVSWFKNSTGVTETVFCVSTDSPLPDEINLDVHSITNKLSSVFLASESLASEAHTDAIQAVLEQMATPVTAAEQPLPLMKAVFGYSAFQSKQEEAINSCVEKKNTFVIMLTGGGKSLSFTDLGATRFNGNYFTTTVIY